MAIGVRVNVTESKTAVETAYGADLAAVLRRLYIEMEYSVYDIQVEFRRRGIEVSSTTISRWLPQHGIEPRGRGNPYLRPR